MEYIFNKIIFGQGDYQEKKKAIEQLFTIEDLLNVPKSLCIKIVKTIGDEYGRFNVSSEFRQGNNWNSEVEGLSYVNDKLYVDIYVQNTKTDTTTSESFDRFFTDNTYSSSNNHLNANVIYNKEEKAMVMCSILLMAVWKLYSNEAHKKDLVERLSHYTLINPICNYYYNEYRLGRKSLSKWSSMSDFAEYKGYYNGEIALRKYIEDNCFELKDKTNEELKIIYMKVFGDAMKEYIKKL